MSALPGKNGINLIPQDKFAAGTFGRILTWLLSTFRVIVIFIEMIVMVAFLSRFWLDAKNSDLNDEILGKQAIIAASKNFEDQYNRTKEKITILSAMTSSPFSDTLTEIPALIPSDIFLTNISSGKTGLTISGQSPFEQSIAQLIVNLKTSNKFDGVNLSQVNFDQESGMLSFQISFKQTAKAGK